MRNIFLRDVFLTRLGITFALFLLCVLGPSHVQADFEDGLFAIHKGEYRTAFREFRSLAESGHTKSQVQLGIMYELGLGVKQNYTEASKWYQKAAVQGDKEAQKKIIDMRRKGLNPTFQPPIPDNWQGNTTEPQAQYDIGMMYFKGIGVKKDYGIAFRWFYLAANQGHARAQNDMAFLLSKGLGVKQNKQEAYFWFLKAAEQGFADAQYNLGVLLTHDTGDGMPQHFLLAYMWFEIAAKNGIMAARKNQVRIADRLDDEQIKEAKALARKWLAKHKTKK
jgi:TPR repeat protein